MDSPQAPTVMWCHAVQPCNTAMQLPTKQDEAQHAGQVVHTETEPAGLDCSWSWLGCWALPRSAHEHGVRPWVGNSCMCMACLVPACSGIHHCCMHAQHRLHVQSILPTLACPAFCLHVSCQEAYMHCQHFHANCTVPSAANAF